MESCWESLLLIVIHQKSQGVSEVRVRNSRLEFRRACQKSKPWLYLRYILLLRPAIPLSLFPSAPQWEKSECILFFLRFISLLSITLSRYVLVNWFFISWGLILSPLVLLHDHIDGSCKLHQECHQLTAFPVLISIILGQNWCLVLLMFSLLHLLILLFVL